MIAQDHPWFNRPTIYDNVLKKTRRQDWSEISREQKDAEINYQIEKNKELLGASKWTK